VRRPGRMVRGLAKHRPQLGGAPLASAGCFHAPVHHPDPVREPVARLHRFYDLLDRGDIGPIPREELVPERDAAPSHDQRNAHLLAVRPVIAAVAPRAVEPMVIDPLGRDPQQVLERGRPIPVLRDVQLARGRAKRGDHRDHGHPRPGNRFAAAWQERGAEFVEPQGPPQRPPSHTSPNARARSTQTRSRRTATACSAGGPPRRAPADRRAR